MKEDDSINSSVESIMKCFDIFVNLSFEYLVSYIAANDRNLYDKIKYSIWDVWNATHKVAQISSEQKGYLFASIDKSISKRHLENKDKHILTVSFSSPVLPLSGVNCNEVRYELIKQAGFHFEVKIVNKKSGVTIKTYALPFIACLQVGLILDHFEAPINISSQWGLDGSSTHIEFVSANQSYSWWCGVPDEWRPLGIITEIIKSGDASKAFMSIVLYRRKRRIDIVGHDYYPKCLFCEGSLERTQKYCPKCGKVILAYMNCSLRAISEANQPINVIERRRISIEEMQQVVSHEKAYCLSHPELGKDRFCFIVKYGTSKYEEFSSVNDNKISFEMTRIGDFVAKAALFCLSCYVKETNDWNGCVQVLLAEMSKQSSLTMRQHFKTALLQYVNKACLYYN